MTNPNQELIVYVDDQGVPTGETAPKLDAHTNHTRLHAAFSCYIFNDNGQILVTRRALTKKVWPGVWTNSVCGHPGPGEMDDDAIVRRAEYELGMTIDDILGDYEDLERDDILATLAYAARLAHIKSTKVLAA